MVSWSASSAVRPGDGCFPSGPRSLGRLSLGFVLLRLGSSPVSRYYRLGPQRLGASSSSVLCSFRLLRPPGRAHPERRGQAQAGPTAAVGDVHVRLEAAPPFVRFPLGRQRETQSERDREVGLGRYWVSGFSRTCKIVGEVELG